MKLSQIFLLSISLLSFQAYAMDPDEIIEIVYDENITYRPGHFRSSSSIVDGKKALSTLPQPPQKPRNQKVSMYPFTLGLKKIAAETEKVLRKVIPGYDGRTRVEETVKWPYSLITQVTIIENGQLGGFGSGAMVGPHHLLTCAHNVYDRKTSKLADKILVYPALNDSQAPFGEVKVVRAYTFKDYLDPKSKQFENNDMALLLLDKSIGQYTGWAGLLATDDKSLSQEQVNITGYPGDKQEQCTQMWTMRHMLKTIMPEMFYYEIDTFGGQSGSPIWVNKWEGVPMILGVHTMGAENFMNWGVRLSEPKFRDFLVKYIAETYVLNEPPSSTDSFDFDQWRNELKKIDQPWAKDLYRIWWRPDIPEIEIHGQGVRGIPLGDEGAIFISEALKHNSSLKKLVLQNLVIEGEGGVALSKALETNTSLNILDLDFNDIGYFGGMAMGNALKTNTSLENLSLRRNGIRDEGGKAIGEALKSNSSLKQLNLMSNMIGDNGGEVIGQALKSNSSLQELNLRNNQIGDEGIIALADALKHNSSLTNLNLRKNKAGKRGDEAIKEACKINKNIKIEKEEGCIIF